MEKQVIFEMTKDGLRAINLIGQPLVTFKMEKGVAVFENHSTGTQHSAHPNIHKSGNVVGMVKNYGWRKTDRVVKVFGYQYNTSSIICSDELDEVCYKIEQGSPLVLPNKIGEKTIFDLKK